MTLDFRNSAFFGAFSLMLMGTAFGNPVAWEPLLSRYCFDCHDSDSGKGGIDLEAALDLSLADQLALWEKSARQMQMRLMPPIEKERPSEEEYVRVVAEMEKSLPVEAMAVAVNRVVVETVMVRMGCLKNVVFPNSVDPIGCWKYCPVFRLTKHSRICRPPNTRLDTGWTRMILQCCVLLLLLLLAVPVKSTTTISVSSNDTLLV